MFRSLGCRWITVRDRTRTPCPYLESTMPKKAGEEAHENGIGMPPPMQASGSKVLNDFGTGAAEESGPSGDRSDHCYHISAPTNSEKTLTYRYQYTLLLPFRSPAVSRRSLATAALEINPRSP